MGVRLTILALSFRFMWRRGLLSVEPGAVEGEFSVFIGLISPFLLTLYFFFFTLDEVGLNKEEAESKTKSETLFIQSPALSPVLATD